MASCTSYTCPSCDFTVDSWDDGNPYVQGPDGERHHFYHPGGEQELEEIVADILGHPPTANEIEQVVKERGGNESDYLCEACLEIVKRDPDRDELTCTECGSSALVDVAKLAGRRCPSCKNGTFDQGALGAIS
ncbi:hypothetical protein [Haloferula sp. A504]|uniref:hypothetical protein n=1 Tax=Haloferula sp. A504 TaxID=3373601 RepID=UPI0031BF5848|nr:hypothetical protein [Verrucomicrobiaceae bacterium E54]